MTLSSGASGQGGSVAAAPPTLAYASSPTVYAPARARSVPTTKPLRPPPITIAILTPAGVVSSSP